MAPNVCECRHGYIGPNCELGELICIQLFIVENISSDDLARLQQKVL